MRVVVNCGSLESYGVVKSSFIFGSDLCAASNDFYAQLIKRCLNTNATNRLIRGNKDVKYALEISAAVLGKYRPAIRFGRKVTTVFVRKMATAPIDSAEGRTSQKTDCTYFLEQK